MGQDFLDLLWCCVGSYRQAQSQYNEEKLVRRKSGGGSYTNIAYLLLQGVLINILLGGRLKYYGWTVTFSGGGEGGIPSPSLNPLNDILTNFFNIRGRDDIPDIFPKLKLLYMQFIFFSARKEFLCIVYIFTSCSNLHNAGTWRR